MSPSTEKPLSSISHVRPAIPDIVEEHLEELALGSLRLRSLTFSFDAPIARQASLVDRSDAHRDGLRLGGNVTRELAERMLTEGASPWMLAAAAWIWCDLVRPDPLALAVRVQQVDNNQLPDWREAMRWLPPETTDQMQEDALRHERPVSYRHLVLDAALWHRRLPEALAKQAVTDSSPLVRWPVARHAAHALSLTTASNLLARLVDDPDADVRSAALWNLALIDPGQGVARALSSDLSVGLRVLGLFGDDHAVARLAQTLADEQRRPTAIAALIDHGSRAAVDALAVLEQAAMEPLANIVGQFDADSGLAAAQAAWPRLASEDLRLWQGQPRPWIGKIAERPARWDWHAALQDVAGNRDLRRLVDDGLLGQAPRNDVEVGA
jgi:hypothetical protein